MISRLYPDKTIEDDCCVDEQSWFVRPPEQFEEQWNVGNDLCLGTRFSEKGVIFALHQFIQMKTGKLFWVFRTTDI